MEVKKLQAQIDAFKSFLSKDRERKELYKWEALSHFQKYWDIDAPDFGNMYDQALQSQTTQRLWKRETWRPKEMMLQLISLEPDFARRMFRNLLDESQNIETRISMFKFGCDEMLSEFKRKQSTSIENNHYHDDFQMILLYLTFRYPESYTFYEYQPFVLTLKQLGITDLPGPYNLERFFKLSKIMYTFLKKDPDLLELHQKRIPSELYYKGESRLLVHDFYSFVGSR